MPAVVSFFHPCLALCVTSHPVVTVLTRQLCGVAVFLVAQVTIGQPRCDPLQVIPDCIAVGLSEARFPLRGKMPGWDSASYGYHSDDGGAFHDAGSMLFT